MKRLIGFQPDVRLWLWHGLMDCRVKSGNDAEWVPQVQPTPLERLQIRFIDHSLSTLPFRHSHD
jgi:hypothetical protein